VTLFDRPGAAAEAMVNMTGYQVVPIGWVESPLKDRVADRDRTRDKLAAAVAVGAGQGAPPPRLGVRWWRLAAGVCLGLACAFNTGLTTHHPYESKPWTWLVLSRPVSYYWQCSRVARSCSTSPTCTRSWPRRSSLTQRGSPGCGITRAATAGSDRPARAHSTRIGVSGIVG
jgi:hypothetical protein